MPSLPPQTRILKAVSGYAADEEDDVAVHASSGSAESAASRAPAGVGAAGRGTVEAALVSKSRRLEHQLTTLRLELAEAKGAAPRQAVRCAVTYTALLRAA